MRTKNTSRLVAAFGAVLVSFLFAATATAAPAISNVTMDPSADIDARQTPRLDVTLAGDDAAYVYVDWTQDDTTVRVYLQGSGTTWSGTLPANHAGSASYVVTAEDADGGLTSYPEQSYTILENTTDADGLSNQRYPNLLNWTKPNSGRQLITGEPVDSDWYGAGIYRLASIAQMVRLRGTTIDTMPTPTASTAGGFVRTRADINNGVGSVWFKAKMSSRKARLGGTIAIDRITYTLVGGRPRYEYKELAEVFVPAATGVAEWHQFHLVVQNETEQNIDGGYYRIRNKTMAASDADRATSAAIDVCDIVLTPLIPDVAIYKDEADYAPGYPSLQDPIEFHIAVSNRFANAPAEHFTPVLVWRQQAEDAWRTTPMTNVLGRTQQGDGTYACALDAGDVEAGPFEYFYKVNYTGYTPRFKAIRYDQNEMVNNIVNDRFARGQYPYLVHTNDWALLTDEGGYVNEGRSPAYKPDLFDAFGGIQYAAGLEAVPNTAATNCLWDLTRKFDLYNLTEGWPHADGNFIVYHSSNRSTTVEPDRLEIKAPFTYLTFLADDGIRRFRSMYTHMTAVPRPWDTAKPGFDIDAGAVPGLDDSYAMQLVGDYTWQAIIHQTNSIDAAFAVTGALHYVEGATSYGNGATNGAASSPFFWLEPEQEETAINPPSAGNVARFGSEEVPHQRTVTYYEERLVTNATPDTVDLLETARPAGLAASIPTGYATVTGGDTEVWHSIAPAWMKADAVRTPGTLAEAVSGDGGQTWFYTQTATLTVDYDDDDNEIVTTNWPAGGAWEPVVRTVSEGGETVAVTNWWPAQIPAAWETLNWGETTAVGDPFPSFTLSALDTNGWDFTTLLWTTNENVTRVEVALSDAAAGWASVALDASALAASTVSTNADASYVATVALGVERDEKTRKETYYTYRPVPDPYTADKLGTRVQIDYDGFLMYRFCTTNGEYQVRRAAWQDFNDWAADINWFSRSFGLYDMQTFECDVEGRATTIFGSMAPTGFEEQHGDDSPDHLKAITGPAYWDGFLAKNAWLIGERQRRTETSQNDNLAVRLSPFSRVPGSIETTKGLRTEGRGTWSMKVRSSADDRIAAVYKNGYDWDDYFLAVQIQASDMSDAQGAYASVIFRYADPENYAEARLVQKGGYRSVQSRMQLCRWLELEVWQTVNGVTTEIKPKYAGGGNYEANGGVNGGSNNNRNFWRFPWWYANEEATTGRYLLTQTADKPWTLGIAVSGTEAEVYLWGGNSNGNANNLLVDTTTEAKEPLREPAYYTLNSALRDGTFGFDVYDVAATFRPWAFPIGAKPDAGMRSNKASECKFKLSKSTAAAFAPVANSADPESQYQQNTDALADRVKPWKVWTGSTGTTAPGIGRGVPTAYYRVRTYRSGKELSDDFSAPVPTLNEDWNSDWDEINAPRSDRVLSVTSYAWQTATLPMNLWDDVYVRVDALPYTAGGADTKVNLGALVVDEFACDAWRGQTVYDPEITGNNAAQRMAVESWVGTYAAIVEDGRTGRKWELARSRANPDEAQAVTTPLMEHGVGDIIFSYQVVGGPVTFVAELLDEDDGSITTIGLMTATPEDTTKSFYAPGLKATSGRIRIRTLGPDETVTFNNALVESGSDIRGVLYLDNLIAHDYPNDADTSWEAYNMLISSFITPQGDANATTLSWQKPLKFDGRARQFDSYRSAVFNDGPANETLLGLPLPDHKPFLQTPSIATGIGEVSFWYRAAPGNTAPASIRIFAANSSLTPDEQWVELTAEDLNPTTERHIREVADMAAITNITTDTWTYFSAEFFEGDYRMLRLYTETNDSCRVLIDNVLITEPVRASIDVGSVEFTPGVPVRTQDTGATVKLVNPRKNPKDIHVYLDWYASPLPARAEEIPTRNIEYETIREPHEVPVTVRDDYGNIIYRGDATYYITKTIAHTNDTVNETLLPPNLPWGYENWPARERATDTIGKEYWIRGVGTIELTTNEFDGPYVFHSTNSIPTTGLPADALVQYCVRVLYDGDFATPILSETQGRTRNGFWFENPEWYAPIDMNLYKGTTERPVAHFWNFTVSTNQAFVNEIMPIRYKSSGWSWMATVGQEVEPAAVEEQFVELIGLNGGDLSGWRIEHAGKDAASGTLSPWAAPVWTNTLKRGASFADANNATTNKGWGIYLIGGSSVTPAPAEALFPAAMNQALAAEGNPDNYGDYAFLRSPYGLSLKRGMGAWADRVCWGGDNYEKDVEDLVAAGFRYVGFRPHNTMGAAQSLAWRGSRSTNAQADWNTQSSLTAGGFNQNQEDILWPLVGAGEDEEKPLIAQPAITAFGWTNGVATVTFSVSVTNGVPLEDGDYVWRVQYSSALDTIGEGRTSAIDVEGGIAADADGTPAAFTFELDLSDSAADANFIRLVATPADEW